MVNAFNIVVGAFFVLSGVLMLSKPYTIAKIHEMFDAIGSRRSSSVEPANWTVSLTKLGGVVGIVVGLFFLITAV